MNRRLIKANSDKIEMSISYTTRPKRDGEVDGEHYHFVSIEKFQELVDNGQMLEWAEVHKNFYGTPVTEINRIREAGKKTLLEIDLQGWFNAQNFFQAHNQFSSCPQAWKQCGNVSKKEVQIIST